MRKISLAVFLTGLLAALTFAGPEPISGKEMKQTVEPILPVQWYRDNEWNVSIWGTYVFVDNEIQSEIAPLPPWEPDRYLGTDDAWGGGVDLKYFFHRYFGVGIQGYALAVHRDAPDLGVVFGTSGQLVTPHDEDRVVGSVLGTFTVRYPIGRFAPYIFVGGGLIFGGGDVENFEFDGKTGNGQDYFEVYRGGDDTEFLGQFGGGLEVRITRHIGVMGDFSWNVLNGPRNNFGMARTGLTFAF
jgi:hypothetical protein